MGIPILTPILTHHPHTHLFPFSPYSLLFFPSILNIPQPLIHSPSEMSTISSTPTSAERFACFSCHLNFEDFSEAEIHYFTDRRHAAYNKAQLTTAGTAEYANAIIATIDVVIVASPEVAAKAREDATRSKQPRERCSRLTLRDKGKATGPASVGAGPSTRIKKRLNSNRRLTFPILKQNINQIEEYHDVSSRWSPSFLSCLLTNANQPLDEVDLPMVKRYDAQTEEYRDVSSRSRFFLSCPLTKANQPLDEVDLWVDGMWDATEPISFLEFDPLQIQVILFLPNNVTHTFHFGLPWNFGPWTYPTLLDYVASYYTGRASALIEAAAIRWEARVTAMMSPGSSCLINIRNDAQVGKFITALKQVKDMGWCVNMHIGAVVE